MHEALHNTRVVLTTGPRQAGKTTLARLLAGVQRPCLSFDDSTTYSIGLVKLAQAARKNFVLGVILYDHDVVLPFGDKLYAAPISCLWH